jgi:hypothetical protein
MKLVDSNRFYLPNTHGQYLHLATLQRNLREYVCFVNVQTQQVYIEEITGGSLQFIEDDKLAEAIHNFLVDVGVLRMDRPLLPDKEWHNMGKK